MTKSPAKPKRKTKVITQEWGERVKQLLAENGWTQVKLCEAGPFQQNDMNQKLNGRRNMTPENAYRIAELFGVRAGWIMGKEKYPTQGEESLAILKEVNTEGELLFTGLAAFAKVMGFDLIPPQLYAGQTAEAAISEVNRGYQIKKDDKSVSLDLCKFNRLENKIADIVNIELSYLLQED